MQIYLEHPTHGKKIAHAVEEARLDMLNGWKKITENKYHPKQKEAEKSE